jgi:hypothetical protein
MKKDTKTLLLIGGLGVGGYLAYNWWKNSQAQAVLPEESAYGYGGGGIITDLYPTYGGGGVIGPENEGVIEELSPKEQADIAYEALTGLPAPSSEEELRQHQAWVAREEWLSAQRTGGETMRESLLRQHGEAVRGYTLTPYTRSYRGATTPSGAITPTPSAAMRPLTPYEQSNLRAAQAAALRKEWEQVQATGGETMRESLLRQQGEALRGAPLQPYTKEYRTTKARAPYTPTPPSAPTVARRKEWEQVQATGGETMRESLLRQHAEALRGAPVGVGGGSSMPGVSRGPSAFAM